MVPSYDDARNGNGEHNNSQMITTSELKISDKFLKILQDNAFNGMDGEMDDFNITMEEYIELMADKARHLIRKLLRTVSEKGHYARNCPKPRVHDSKYFMEQMLLAKQDEAGVNLTGRAK
ncbi:hypothetical protein Tco_1004956 [Tanacetum coccineum]|uniref:Uncharacterized protein n=1 Tax=Tanacetum coccineum TaxID=301880 RepID=A0ABQ5FE10_9ASTR